MAERDLHPKSRLLTSACHQALFCILRVGLASDYETEFGLKKYDILFGSMATPCDKKCPQNNPFQLFWDGLGTID